MKLNSKVILIFGLLIAANVTSSVFSLSELAKVKDISHDITIDLLPSIRHLGATHALISEYRNSEAEAIMATTDEAVAKAQKDSEATLDEITKEAKAFEALIAGGDEESKAYQEFDGAWLAYLKESAKVWSLVRENRSADAITLFEKSRGTFAEAAKGLDDLIQLNAVEAESADHEAAAIYSESRSLIHLIQGLVLLASVVACYFLIRTVVRPIRTVTSLASAIAGGDVSVEVPAPSSCDEIGELLVAMKELHAAVNKSFMLGQVLEELPMNIMQCEPKDFRITFMNRATRETLTRLQEYMPCKVSEMVGKSIDMFHKHPEHQRGILRDPRNLPHEAKITLGSEKLSLYVTACMDKRGHYMGPVLTWKVITSQLNVANKVKEMVGVVSSAAIGS